MLFRMDKFGHQIDAINQNYDFVDVDIGQH